MKFLLAAAASTTVLALAGCSAGPKPTQITRLDCPKTERDLTLVKAATDGKSCSYVSSAGAEVNLSLVPVQGGVDATLQRIESELRAGLAAAAPAAGVAAGAAGPDAASPKAHLDRAAVEAQAEADATADVEGSPSKERDGKWEVAHGDGDHAKVDLPGIHIDARDESAQVRVGPLHIDADEDGAEMRMSRDVRLRGESLSREKRGVRATLILTGDDVASGYAYGGYSAAGPKSGPLAVAQVRGKAGDPEDLYKSVEALVRRNGGV